MPIADLRRFGLATVAALSLVATAAPAAAQARDPDPFEGVNRRFFALNSYLDRTVLRPVALAWKQNVPAPIRSGVRNFVTNLSEPVVFANDVLQGRAADASVSGGRFVINSTVGVGGLIDVGKAGGLPRHDNNFGATLARNFKAGPGAYVYLPVLGPTTVRDGIGQAVDILFNPLTWIRYSHQFEAGLAIGAAGGINARADADAELQAIRNQATDEYATLRSLFLQNRAAQIAGRAVDVNALPDFDDPAAPGGVAAPGSVSPTGAPARPSSPGVAPTGDAGALPRPSNAPDAQPPAPAQPRDEEVADSSRGAFFGALADELASAASADARAEG